MADFPEPGVDETTRPYWDRLAAGELCFARCDDCGHAWLPLRQECPVCWSDRHHLEPSSGRGRIISWIVYHRAYHPYFADRLPYNVAVVELDEGPRLLTNVLCDSFSQLSIDAPVELVIEEDHGWSLARFRLTAGTDGFTGPVGGTSDPATAAG